jgi:hypothetical protein
MNWTHTVVTRWSHAAAIYSYYTVSLCGHYWVGPNWDPTPTHQDQHCGSLDTGTPDLNSNSQRRTEAVSCGSELEL